MRGLLLVLVLCFGCKRDAPSSAKPASPAVAAGTQRCWTPATAESGTTFDCVAVCAAVAKCTDDPDCPSGCGDARKYLSAAASGPVQDCIVAAPCGYRDADDVSAQCIARLTVKPHPIAADVCGLLADEFTRCQLDGSAFAQRCSTRSRALRPEPLARAARCVGSGCHDLARCVGEANCILGE
jgi:hypothetical protein